MLLKYLIEMVKEVNIDLAIFVDAFNYNFLA